MSVSFFISQLTDGKTPSLPRRFGLSYPSYSANHCVFCIWFSKCFLGICLICFVLYLICSQIIEFSQQLYMIGMTHLWYIYECMYYFVTPLKQILNSIRNVLQYLDITTILNYYSFHGSNTVCLCLLVYIMT